MRNALPLLFRFTPTMCLVMCLGVGLLVLTPLAVAATPIFKCAGDGGIPVYQDTPCEEGKELRNLTGEDTLSVIPMRPAPSRLSPPPPPAEAGSAAGSLTSTPPPSPVTETPLHPALPTPLAVPVTPTMLVTPPTLDPAAAGVQLQPVDPALEAAREITPVVLDYTPLTPPPAEAPATAQPGAAALARTSITRGMTAAEVESRLGPPPMTGGGGSDAPNLPVRWFYLPTEGDSDTITTIVLQNGKVTDVERKPVKRN